MSAGDLPRASDSRWRTGWVAIGASEPVRLASPGIRLAARVLDALVAYTLFFILRDVVGIYVLDADSSSVASRLFAALMMLLVLTLGYEVVQTAIWGQTIGKRVVDIRVVDASNGEPPGWGRALIRWAVPLVPVVVVLRFVDSPVAFLISALVFLSLVWDRKKQGWHDKAAGTFVVKTGVLVSER